MSKEATKTVTFKLSAERYRQLEEIAEADGDSSPHLAAKRMLLDALTHRWHTEVAAELHATNQGLANFREDLATTLVTLLVACAGEDRDKAEAWVAEHLVPTSPR